MYKNSVKYSRREKLKHGYKRFKRRVINEKVNHPTQKPVALMERCIEICTNPNDLVLDFCMGSGSTGVACKNHKRDFIGIENNEDYFKIAEKRIKEHAVDIRKSLF